MFTATLHDALTALKSKIRTNNATYEDYYLELNLMGNSSNKSFSVGIEYESDSLSEIQVYGEIPSSNMFTVLSNAEDDEEVYRDITVTDFLANGKSSTMM